MRFPVVLARDVLAVLVRVLAVIPVMMRVTDVMTLAEGVRRTVDHGAGISAEMVLNERCVGAGEQDSQRDHEQHEERRQLRNPSASKRSTRGTVPSQAGFSDRIEPGSKFRRLPHDGGTIPPRASPLQCVASKRLSSTGSFMLLEQILQAFSM